MDEFPLHMPLEEPFTCPSLIGNKLLLSFLTSVLKPKIEIDIRGPDGRVASCSEVYPARTGRSRLEGHEPLALAAGGD
eukprot:g9608.t1